MMCACTLDVFVFFFFSSSSRHTRSELLMGVQTCALRSPPIQGQVLSSADRDGPFAAGPAICDNGVSHETRLYSPRPALHQQRSEEHTSELQSLMRISYAVFCL